MTLSVRYLRFNLLLVLLITLIKKLLVHFHKNLKSIINQSMNSPAESNKMCALCESPDRFQGV